MHGVMRCLVAVLFLATAASWAPMRPFAGRLRASKCRECASVQMSLRMPEDARTIDALIDQTKDSRAVVVLHYNDPSAFASPPSSTWDTPSWDSSTSWSPQTTLSGTLVERVANEYSSSQLYGGAPLVVLQIDADMSPGDVICSQRGIVSFPRVEIWAAGLCEEVVAGDLEQKILALGVASRTKKMDTTIGTASFESSMGTGLPSADAVDEIDFTGGRALGTTKDGKRGIPNSGVRGTNRFFPGADLGEKPGDNMGSQREGGTPGSAPRKPRDDVPPGDEPWRQGKP